MKKILPEFRKLKEGKLVSEGSRTTVWIHM